MDRNNAISSVHTNTDTGLLKAVAFGTMLIDHIGYIFFPSEMWLRIIGRIAFPLFAYCLAVGALCTRSVKKYALRLLVFAAVSQPFYTLALYESSFKALFDPLYYSSFELAALNIYDNFHLNIGFTLLLGLWAIYGIRERKYFYTVAALLLSALPAVEYGAYGVALIILMYSFCRCSRTVFGFAAAVFLVLPFIINDGFYSFFGLIVDPQGFAVLALPFILINTNTGIKIPRWINYGFYPLHLAVLYFINLFFQ